MLSARHQEDKERVRDASDIVRVIGEHLTLKAKGREYVGLCPFHDDHKPSMNVVPGKQIFHCFVCAAGGDVFSFIQKYHGMEFREALEYLAERAGIELTKARPEPVQPGTPAPISRADLIRANASAANFFCTLLAHPQHGQPGRTVIEQRGISPEMVEAFQLGLSPDRWDGLILTIQSLGADLRSFLEAGLLKARDSGAGGFYDSFRHRLMFPIHDQLGRVIAFGARKLREDDDPKYLNSPETRIFQKAGTLYGLFQASRSIQSARTAIITEGYTDTIACHQAGFTNAVATLGTALTRQHAAVLRRLCDTVVLLFDGDEAGQKAADRAVEVFFAEQIDVKIATLARFTDAKDPDELLKREEGAETLRQALDKAIHILEYRLIRRRESLEGAGISAVSRAVQEELNSLSPLGFNELPMYRRMMIVRKINDQLARLGITMGEKAIAAAIPGGRGANQPMPSAPSPRPQLSPREQALGCLFCYPELWNDLSDAHREQLDAAHFSSPVLSTLADLFATLAASGEPPSFPALCSHLESLQHAETATDLHTRMEQTTEGDPARAAAWLRDCLGLLAADDHPLSLELVRAGRANNPNRRMLPRPG